ncbi:MAG: S41 family peptidase [Clostridia bacterium]|nr:S41 family peptidase [Clostridia bacterium]
MKRRLMVFALILALLAGALAAFSAVGETRRGTVTIDRDEYNRLLKYEKLDEVMQYINAYYYQEPDTDKMLDYAVQGMLAGLGDPYTFYYDAESWESMWEDEEGEYTGIGIQMLANYDDQTVKITRVFRDTPAEKAGLRKNDILVRAEDLEVTAETMDAAVKIIRGEVGGQVQVEVLRGEESITFDITRASIHTNNVDYAMLDNNVGYVILYQFSTDSLISDFNAALDALEAQGAASIILDLRDNPGGWVEDAVKVADRFLDSKLVVYSKTRYSSDTNPQYTKSGSDKIPLVVLVNENSASSSEILTGALQDHNRATVVGTQTFGKGIMQYVLGLSDNETGIQLTYCEYFTPNGNHVHGIGLTPDIVVEMPKDMTYAALELGDMSDPQLQAAWDEAVKLQ